MTSRFQSFAAITAFGLVALAPAAIAQKQSANRMMTPDTTFATKAAQGGIAEVQMGQLAKDHASSQAIKDYGQKMIDDHSKANDQLKQILSSKSMTLPDAMNATDQATYDRLSKLNGAEFDRAYMSDMVKDHRADINEFKREANGGKDPDLKQFASDALTTLQSHLQMAESTYNEIKK
jgi:putative membrane protein